MDEIAAELGIERSFWSSSLSGRINISGLPRASSRGADPPCLGAVPCSIGVGCRSAPRDSRGPRQSAKLQRMSSPSAQRRSRHRYTYEEYLAYERDSGLKHEYEDGEILAMAGGSRRHNALASRISAALETARKSGCVAFQSD